MATLAINTGGSAASTGGVTYSADQFFSGGSTYAVTNAIASTTDDILYQSERVGRSFSYALPLADGDYSLTLRFAEIWYNAPGLRVFDVTAEGVLVLDDLDLWTVAGGRYVAWDFVIPVTVTDGVLNLQFTSSVDKAKISAIFVTSASPSTGVSVTQSGGSTAVTEGGATDTLSLALTSQPTANVTINVAGNADVGASPTALTFTPANWSTAQTVTLAAVNDSLVEGAESASITFTTTSGDSAYNGLAIAPVTVSVIDNDGTGTGTTFERRIAASADDVEQRGSRMSMTSSDLELVTDGNTLQIVGLRFTNIDIPAGAVITSAYIQFQADAIDSVATSLLIRGFAADDAAAFVSIANNLSSRPTTSASVSWQPAAWTLVNEAGTNQRTTDLTAVVQEIVSRSGWQAGNDLGFMITGSGTRSAHSFDGSALRAPLLHIEYTLGGGGTNAAPAIDLDGSAAGTGFSTTFASSSGGVPIADSDSLITDSDDSQMQRLTVTLTNAKVNDQLLVSGALPTGIAIDPASTATNLILTGTASIAAYQSAVEQVRFNNTGAAPDTTTRQVQVTVNDGEATSSPATASIAITAAGNAAPVLDLDGSASGTGFSTIFTVAGGGVRIADTDVSITDSDDSNMERLTVTLVSPKSGDQLLVSGTLPTGIGVDPGSTSSSLILTGSASLAAYRTAVQQVRFNNAGPSPDPTTRQVQVTVNDGAATSNLAVATIAIDSGGSTGTTFERRVAASADDVEQRGSSMSLTSSDLELVTDGTTVQIVGLRFTNIDIPAGAVVTRAYIQFQADATGSTTTSLLVRGLAADDLSAFTSTANNLSSRPTTSASVSWQPAAWTSVDASGDAERTTDLTSVVQEIIGRSGWQAGNDLGFMITGSGVRSAHSFDGSSGKAPLLHIEYSLGQSSVDIDLSRDPAFRENVAGALVGTLSVANPEPGESYIFSVSDSRFQVVGNNLMLKDGVRLDFERTPVIQINVTARDTSGDIFIDSITAAVGDVAETRFAAFGDFGNRVGAASVAALVDALNPDFIITTGDNLYNDEPIDDQIGNKYADYIGNYNGSYGPGSTTNRFWPSIGNHEYSDGGGISAYLDYFTLPDNERYYDFVIGPVHFFAINSDPHEPDGRTSTSVQAQWLQAGLAASDSPYKIVYFHHPPFNSGTTHGPDTVMRWPFEAWGATAVLNGHEHLYERFMRDDNNDGTFMPYFITGLGGADRYNFGTPQAGSVFRYRDDFGTMLIQASDESITFEFYSVTGGGQGTLIDSFTIDLPAGAAQFATASEPVLAAELNGDDPIGAFGRLGLAETDMDPFGMFSSFRTDYFA